ncbi:MAG: hypothetical protein V1742_06305 [Pseudomonadota bacterium]
MPANMESRTSAEGFNFSGSAQVILSEMQNLLSNIYADLAVSRDRVRNLAEQGKKLVDKEEIWVDGAGKKHEFLNELEGLERKIYQTLDLKKLKEEGLVKAVKL